MKRSSRRPTRPDSITLFCTVDHCPIHWTDSNGVTHACEGAVIHDGTTEIWTLCGRDVPATFAFSARHARRKLTCRRCKAIEGHHHAPALVLID
jgi:hypothetical protein